MDIVDQGFLNAKKVKLQKLKHTIKRMVKEILKKKSYEQSTTSTGNRR